MRCCIYVKQHCIDNNKRVGEQHLLNKCAFTVYKTVNRCETTNLVNKLGKTIKDLHLTTTKEIQ